MAIVFLIKYPLTVSLNYVWHLHKKYQSSQFLCTNLRLLKWQTMTEVKLHSCKNAYFCLFIWVTTFGDVPNLQTGNLKGVWHEISTSCFFTNQFPPGPWVSSWGHFEFLQKFAEIFANLCLSQVSLTPVIKPFTGILSIPWHRQLIYRW